MATDVRARVETLGLGWWLAVIVAIASVMLGFMQVLPKEVVMVILAICAVRL